MDHLPTFSRAFAVSFRGSTILYLQYLDIWKRIRYHWNSNRFGVDTPGYSPVGCHCFRLNVGWRKSVWHNWRSTERITRHAGWGGLTCDFRVGISVRFFCGLFLDFLASSNFVVGSWACVWWVGDIAKSWCLAFFMMKLHLWDFDSSFVSSLRDLDWRHSSPRLDGQARAAQEEMLRARLDAHDGIFHHLRFLVNFFGD